MDLLEMPLVFPRLDVDRHDGVGVEIVAAADRAIERRAGIGGHEIEQAQFGIDRRCLPDCGAAVFPDVAVLRPGFVAGLARRGDRVVAPDMLAGVGVIGVDMAADAEVAAAEAGNDHAVVIKRRAGDRIALGRVLGLDFPQHLAGLLVERDELGVELADEDLAVAHAGAATGPAAARPRLGGVDIRLVAPQHLAGIDADREDVVLAGLDVDDAVIGEDLSLIAVARVLARSVERGPPDRLQIGDVGTGDLVERRIALVIDIAAIGVPAVGRRGSQLLGREGGRGGDIAVGGDRGCPARESKGRCRKGKPDCGINRAHA